MKESQMIADIALFITAIGVLGVVVGLRQSYLERLQQFEAKYVERYWHIIDQLSLDALRGTSPVLITDDDSRIIRSYILLCEDELEMRKNGYISDSTYDLWADGIQGQFQQSMFKEIWDQVKKENVRNQTFPYEHLRQLLDEEERTSSYDPLTMPGWRRWIRGLAGVRWVRGYAGLGRSRSPHLLAARRDDSLAKPQSR
jgi:hypothetical protein